MVELKGLELVLNGEDAMLTTEFTCKDGVKRPVYITKDNIEVKDGNKVLVDQNTGLIGVLNLKDAYLAKKAMVFLRS